MKIVVVSGGFDPIHSGHIAYFNAAKDHGDILVVALNSDDWLIDKKSKYFMPFAERKNIIENLHMVDKVIDFEDDEHKSCSLGLEKIKKMYPDDEIFFCNGGDRTQENIPEMSVEGINFLFGIGGEDKKNSSSWILKDYSFDFEERVWGKFYNLFEDTGDTNIKLKELIVAPKIGLSFQKHFYRSEIWFVSKGACTVNYSEGEAEDFKPIDFKLEDVLFIKKGAWHQIINPYDKPCHIIEIQYGEKTIEEDIERLRYFDEEKSL
jgi:cytidyltransferase-like protein